MSLILPYKGISPQINKTAFIAQNAVISGDVTIEADTGIWYSCTVRGDVAKITIGNNTNIQDNTVIHVAKEQSAKGEDGITTIGNNVTVGHSCIIHACTLENNTFVGMGSIVMDFARIEEHGMLAAGAMLTSGKTIKSKELWIGSPAKFFRMLTQKEIDHITISANNYRILAQEHAESKDTKGK